MKSIIFVVLLFVVGVVVSTSTLTDAQLKQAYENYKAKFKVQFDTPAEDAYRYTVWLQNMEDITNLNRENNYIPGLIINIPVDTSVSEAALLGATQSQLDQLALHQSNAAQLGVDSVAAVQTITIIPSSNAVGYSMNPFTHLTLVEKTQLLTGIPLTAIPVAAAAGLAAGTIAAIAVGGAVVAGASVGGVVVYKKYKKNNKTKEVEMQPTPTPTRSAGLDMFNFDGSKSHQSITARAMPQPSH